MTNRKDHTMTNPLIQAYDRLDAYICAEQKWIEAGMPRTGPVHHAHMVELTKITDLIAAGIRTQSS